MKTARTLNVLILGLVLALTAGAALAAPPMAAPLNPAPRDPALAPVFKQFGEKPGLVSLVNDFMDNLMADPVTRPFFADANRDHIKKELVDQFCVILDGPCTYTGLDMQQAHKGLNITEADFNALVVDLQKAMDKHGIPFTAQNQLLAKLAPMHRDVDTK